MEKWQALIRIVLQISYLQLADLLHGQSAQWSEVVSCLDIMKRMLNRKVSRAGIFLV
jgi:hypothetical protein